MFEIILTSIYASIFIYIIYQFKFFQLEGFSKVNISSLFIFKLSAGIILAIIYTYYYPNRQSADIYKYFDDGETIFQVFLNKPIHYFQIVLGLNTESPPIKEILERTNYWYKPSESAFYNDNRTMIKFNALIRLFSFGSIGVHTAVMCFLSFIGLTALYKTCVKFMPDKKKELIIAIYLLPSVIFWGSGLIKEGFVLFVMGGFIYFGFQLIHRSIHIKYLLGFLLFTFLFLFSKLYVLLALLPPLIGYWICEKFKSGNIFLKLGSIYFLCLICTLNVHYLLPDHNMIEILWYKQHEFINHAMITKAGSFYQIPSIEPNLMSVLQAFPIAIINVITRPAFFDFSSPIIFLAIIENIGMLLVIGFCLLFFKKKSEHLNFTLFCLGFALLLFGIIGITTPVLGAVARYKIPGLPFFLIFFIFYYNKSKVLQMFPIFKFLKS